VSFCAQDALDPILARAVGQAELAELRFGTEVSGVRPDPAGVTVELTDRRDGTRRVVRADYLIAADGANSAIREALGIGMTGHDLSAEINVLFEADLSAALGVKRAILYRLHNQWPPHGGLFRNIDGRHRWTLFTRDSGDARPARLAEIIRGCAGDPDLAVKIVASGAWRKAALLAGWFRAGRVFLAGDAAHVVPPNGGYGGNTGVQDAHNLAWKLALTLAGTAGPGLLDSYDAERRPVGELTVEQAFTRYVTRVAPYLGTENTQPIVDDFSMEIGYRYDSPAVVLEPGSPPLHEHPRESAGRPGARAPHVFLDRDGTRLSTLDLFGRNFVLLSGPEGQAWQAAAPAAAKGLGVTLDVHVVGGDGLADAGGSFPGAFGISPSGAVLVRPDGFVGWRAVTAADAPEDALRQALQTLLCRGDD